MSSYTVEGFWDCAYCGTREIGGLQRKCPGCGRPRGDYVEFYLKDHSPDKAIDHQTYGPDWLCPYCETYNSAKYSECQSCGNYRSEEDKDYFKVISDNIHKGEKEIKDSSEQNLDQKQNKDKTNLLKKLNFSKFKNKKLIIPISIILILLLVAIPIYNAIFYKNITVTEKVWKRTIEIESFETVNEEDWYLPSNARLNNQKQEIHHYISVFSHYESRTRQVPETVFDGYDTYTETINNRDGTFRIETRQVPKYKTIWKTEYYQEPIYVQKPVFQTKYYYEIEKWIHKRDIVTSGNENDKLIWGLVNLEHGIKKKLGNEIKSIGQERESQRHEVYSIISEKGKSYSIEFDKWIELEIGQNLKLKLNLSSEAEILE